MPIISLMTLGISAARIMCLPENPVFHLNSMFLVLALVVSVESKKTMNSRDSKGRTEIKKMNK